MLYSPKKHTFMKLTFMKLHSLEKQPLIGPNSLEKHIFQVNLKMKQISIMLYLKARRK
jgi:hypothetical protein